MTRSTDAGDRQVLDTAAADRPVPGLWSSDHASRCVVDYGSWAVRLAADLVARIALDLRTHPPARPLAAVMVDVERLGIVSLALGAPAADAVLAAFRQRIEAWAHGAGTLRDIGGGRYLVLLPGVPAGEALARSHVLAEALRAPVATAAGTVVRNAAIGVAGEDTDEPATDVTDLIRQAELALEAGPAPGGTRVLLWNHGAAVAARRAAQLEVGLQRALGTGEGLLLHFQPEVDLRDGTLLAVEALARWRHPSLGLLGPETFIPVAEASGVIADLGRWVLGAAFAQRARWAEEFPAAEFVLRVNVSPTQLHDPLLPEHVAALLEQHRLPGASVGVELTEEVRAIDSPRAVTTLEALRKLGLQIAIDDFGVAHSSPARLDSFPFDTVKIDGRFIHAMSANETNRYVVSTVVHLAERLGMAVVAEGVETAEDVARMVQLGCVHGQGNGLLPAVDASCMSAVIAAGRVDLPRS